MKRTILLFLLSGIVFACIYEDDSYQTGEESLIEEAKKWYGENMNDPGSIQFDTGGPEMLIQPDWKRPFVNQKGKYATVELPILGDEYFSIVDPECRQKFEETNDSRYLSSKITLVIRKNLTTGEIDGFIMAITPNLQYLESVNLAPFRRNTYLERDKNLGGHIIYYDLSGRFVNGWQYVEGKAYSVRLEVVNEQNAKLRSAYCYDILEYSYTVHGQIGGVEWIEGVMTCVITGYSYEVYVYSTHCVGGDSGDGEYGEGSSSDDSDESSGDYGGGGDNTPQPVAPKAKQIFKNSNMTDANWEKIEKMLIKIMEDCLGAALYDGLVDELDGKALAIQFSNGSSFNYTNGTITLDVMEAESNRLYHEMWHAYQSYYETTASFGTSTLNQEMEAWYVQYLYLSKLPEYKEGSKWHQWYRATELGMAVQDLKEFVDSKGNLLQGEVPLYGYLYNTLEPTFRNNGYPLSGYSFDYNRDGGYNFRNLRRLSKDC